MFQNANCVFNLFSGFGFDEVNSVGIDTKLSLRKRQYDFSRANGIVKKWNKEYEARKLREKAARESAEAISSRAPEPTVSTTTTSTTNAEADVIKKDNVEIDNQKVAEKFEKYFGYLR